MKRAASCIVFAAAALVACDNADKKEHFRDGSTAEIVQSITSKDKKVDLVLTTRSLYMQLSEEMLEEIHQEMAEELDEDEGSKLGNTIKGAVLGSVQEMLAERIEYPLDEVNAIYWDRGAIVIDVEDENFITFDDVDINDEPALESFREKDARELINAFDRIKDERQ